MIFAWFTHVQCAAATYSCTFLSPLNNSLLLLLQEQVIYNQVQPLRIEYLAMQFSFYTN